MQRPAAVKRTFGRTPGFEMNEAPVKLTVDMKRVVAEQRLAFMTAEVVVAGELFQEIMSFLPGRWVDTAKSTTEPKILRF
jgi:hypothetical protein